MIYYNTKTTNTVELSQEEFKKLKPQVAKNYRKAGESEIELYKTRTGKKAVKDAAYAKRKKEQEKNLAKKEKAKAKVKADSNTGTSDAPKSDSSN